MLLHLHRDIFIDLGYCRHRKLSITLTARESQILTSCLLWSLLLGILVAHALILNDLIADGGAAMDGRWRRETDDSTDDVDVILMVKNAQSKPFIRYVHRTLYRKWMQGHPSEVCSPRFRFSKIPLRIYTAQSSIICLGTSKVV